MAMKNLERLKQAILALDADTTEAFEAFQVVSAQTADLLAACKYALICNAQLGYLNKSTRDQLETALARAEGGEGWQRDL